MNSQDYVHSTDQHQDKSSVERSVSDQERSRKCQKEAILQEAEEQKEHFYSLYRIMTPVLRRIAARKLPPQEIEDVLQETWLALWRSRNRFLIEEAKHCPCWLCKVLRHKVIDFFRSRLELVVDDLEQKLVVPAGLTLVERRRSWVDEKIDEVRERNFLSWKLLYGHYRERRTYADLAAETGLTVKAVERRLSKLIKLLRQEGTEAEL